MKTIHHKLSPAPDDDDTPNRVPAHPVNPSPNAFWVSPGTKVRLGDYSLPGFLYVGEGLTNISGVGTEPALINPALPVDKTARDLSLRRTDYWPSYKTSSPEARGAYLQWLTSGKSAPEADIGLVFLYFYGLERRALADPLLCAVPEQEQDLIIQEVKRLLNIYSHRSFQKYARSFVDILEAKKAPDGLYKKSLPKTNTFTLLHRIALAQCAADAAPLPLHWALAWLELDPDFSLSSAARQCRREFRELFSIRYGEKFKKGLILSPSRAPVSFEYRPASPSFSTTSRLFGFVSDLHEVNAFSPGAVKLSELAEECCQALSGYARSVLKSTDSIGSSGHLLELPYVLWSQSDKNQLEKLRFELQRRDKPIVLPAEGLQEKLGDHLQFGKSHWRALLERLAEAGIGVEPGATVSGQLPVACTHVALFLPSEAQALGLPASSYYIQAAVAAQLGLAMCFIDSGPAFETSWLLSKVEEDFRVPDPERPRLAAHLYRVRAEGPRTTGLKGLTAGLDIVEKEAIGEFILQLSETLGPLTAARRKVLESAFKALSLSLSALPELPAPQPDEPALLVKGETTEKAHTIRPPGPVFELDTSKIKQLEAETREVAELLSGIFASEPAETLAPAKPPELKSVEAQSPSALWGLDSTHSELARVLATQSTWSRKAVEALCEERGLLSDGALETLNEACMDSLDEPFIEGFDPIDVYCNLVKENS